MRYVVFDADGVLVDSEEAITVAYTLAGVRPPSSVLRLEGDPWVQRAVGLERTPEVKREKDRWYVEETLRKFGRVNTEALQLARDCFYRGDFVIMLTGAPLGSLKVMRSMFNDWPFNLALAKMRTTRKIQFMHALGADGDDRPHDECGFFIDDQPLPHGLVMPPAWKYVQYQDRSGTPAHVYTRREMGL